MERNEKRKINLKSKIMNTISKNYIVNHIESNYGQMRHDADKMAKAIRQTAKEYELDKKALFHYIVERENTIPMATSYGFDTWYGRAIRETFEYNYYNN